MPVTNSKPSLKDLLTLVGAVLLLWGHLESEIDRQIVRLKQKLGDKDKDGREIGAPFGTRLKYWENLYLRVTGDQPLHGARVSELLTSIEQISAVRNLICHGLRKASNLATEVEPTIVCISRCARAQTDEVTLGYREIEKVIAKLEELCGNLVGLRLTTQPPFGDGRVSPEDVSEPAN